MDDTTIDKPTTMLQNTTTTRYMYNMTDDFSISLMEVQSFQTVIEILQVVTVIVCFTGLLLNILCLIALAHTPRVFFKKFKLIISLSVSDSLIIFVILHHQLGRSEDDSHCLRLLNRLLTHTSFLATLLNLAMMALDTCFYTTHVYSYPRFMTNFKTSCMVFIVWSVSIVFSLTEVFVGAAIMTEQSTNQTSFCRTVDLDEYRTDDVIIHFIIIVIVIMSIAYIKIAMVARRMQRADIIQNQNNNMNSYKTVITTGLFILTFAVCWVPYGMFHLYLMYKRKLDEDFLQTPRSFQQALLANGILNIIMLLNSIADPLIYAVRLKEVRKGYKLFYQNILSACLFFSPAKCFKDKRKFATTERRKTISTTISGQDWLNEKYNDSEELQTMNEESPSSNRQANHANTESDLTMEPLCDNKTSRVM